MQTTDLGLRLYEGTDKFNPLIVENENTQDISDEILSLQEDVITVATELASGTVHALTRENPNTAVMRFTATANWTSGDTCTVDGVQVSTLLPSGATLGTGAYIIGSEVLCVLVGTRLTMYLTGVSKADDSDKLGGELPSYYGTAEDTAQALATAQAASTISQATQLEVNQINEDLVELENKSTWKLMGSVIGNTKFNITENFSELYVIVEGSGAAYSFYTLKDALSSVSSKSFLGGLNNNLQNEIAVRISAVDVQLVNFILNGTALTTGASTTIFYR